MKTMKAVNTTKGNASPSTAPPLSTAPASAQLKREVKDALVFKHIELMVTNSPNEIKAMAKRSWHAISYLVVCSLCAGTNMMPLVAMMLSLVLSCGKVADAFQSETNVSKQLFGKLVSDVTCPNKAGVCVFPDVRLIGVKTAFRKTHSKSEGEHCPVPGKPNETDMPELLQPLLGTCGICCTNYSGLFNGLGSVVA